MFLFESSKEKQIRLGVQKNMQICISNPKKYNEAKEALVGHIRGSDQKVIQMIVDNIKATIKNEDLQPIRKYQAMLLLKDLMLTHNKALGKYVVKKILKRLTILAMHKSGSNNDREEERGKDIFGPVKRDQETYAVQFFTTLLTALQQWGKNWPKAPDGPFKDFQRQYNELLMNGVQFPKQRPKQTSKSPIKPLREDNKTPEAINPSVSPNRVSIDKPKPKVSVDKKDNPRRSSIGKSNQLKSQLSKFYQKIAQSFLFLEQILQNSQIQQLLTIKDTIVVMQKQIQKGNQYVISMQDLDECENDQVKIESMFSFMQKIQKDLKILDKKPQQFKVFQNKYLKLIKRTLQILLSKTVGKKDKPAPIEKVQNVTTPNTSSIQEKPVSRIALQKRQEPKIKNQNRYASVTGQQVLQQFAKNNNLNQFQSHSANSVSDRFGSFGGLPGVTERPKTVISLSPANPAQNKINVESNSEHKNQSPQRNQQYKADLAPELPIRSMPQTGVRNDSKRDSEEGIDKSKNQQNNFRLSQVNKSNNFFEQFQNNQQNSNKQIDKISKKSSKQDDFTAQKFPKNQANSSEDFFGQIENKPQAINDLSKISRRKINAETRQDPQNIFNNIPSKVNSEGLSAFQFPNPASTHAAQPIQTRNSNQNNSVKQVLDDNPFNLEAFARASENSQHNASNFFDQFQKKPESDILKKSVSNKSNFFADEEVWQKRQSAVNPFQTGNFASLKNKQLQKNSQAGSVKSKNSKENPFQNSFEINLKNSRAQKFNFANPLEPDNPFDSARGNNNPVSSPFDDPLASQRLQQNENPFQTSSHPSQKANKNPFDELQEFYRPQDKPVKEGLTKRNSLENNGRIIAQQVRDSLVLAANLDQSQNGLNFSQFADIGANNQNQKENPFKSDGSSNKGSNHQKSGFSLSNFPGIGDQAVPKLQNGNSSNDIQNFFSQFEKPSIISRESKKQLPDLRQQDNFFENFNLNDKPQQKKGRPADNLLQKQKTVFSHKQKSQNSVKSRSFDFEQLENISLKAKQQRNRKQSIAFEDFLNLSKQKIVPVQSLKQNVQFDNEKQKSLSWGDFDKETPKNSLQNQQNKASSSLSQLNKDLDLKSIQVTPVINQQTIKQKQLLQLTDKKGQESAHSSSASVNLNIGDFIPLGKKGQQWNPLLKLKNAKPASFYYNVDDKKIAMKKAQLQQIQKNYKEKVNIFKLAKLKNEQVRDNLLQKMKKLNTVIHQKQEFQQILKKIKETNDLKQKQISQIHSKIKKVEDIKNKILMKERKLYEITKFQINKEEKKNIPQRTMSSKWEIFNKNLQYQRNLSYTSISRFSQG